MTRNLWKPAVNKSTLKDEGRAEHNGWSSRFATTYLNPCKQQHIFASAILCNYRLVLVLLELMGCCHHGNTSKTTRHLPPLPSLPSANLEWIWSCLCGFYLGIFPTHISLKAELLEVLQIARLCILPSAGPKVNCLYDLLLALISAHNLSCVSTT